MSRKLFIAPAPLKGFIFKNSAGEKTLITNDTFTPWEDDEADLEQAPFDISVQANIDNVQSKINSAREEIQQAIENFE